MVKLKEITSSSWLVIDDEKEQSQLGILSKTSKAFSLLMNKNRFVLNSEEELDAFFNVKDLMSNTFESFQQESTEHYVNGYPVDCPEIHEVADSDTGLPLFTKTEKSTIEFTAGYYCLKYPKGWTQSFCPKISTLNSYERHGPFKTKMEMNLTLNKLKKNDKVRKD